MTATIFSTVHGSHLYGMPNDTSDRDIFVVTDSPKPRARHTFNQVEGIDTVRMGFDTFIRYVFEGSHQAVEALFSPYKVWNEDSPYSVMLQSYTGGMRIYGEGVFAKYERTIKRFCYGDFKRRRHAVRLQWNLTSLRCEGRFNPVMAPSSIRIATEWAEKYEGDDLWEHLTSRQ
jgi:hypothetical protein